MGGPGPRHTLDMQVVAVIRSAFTHFNWAASCGISGQKDLVPVVHTLVTLRLDYCSGVAFEKCSETSVGAKRCRCYVDWSGVVGATPVLAHLHKFPVSFQVQFKVLLSFKTLAWDQHI